MTNEAFDLIKRLGNAGEILEACIDQVGDELEDRYLENDNIYYAQMDIATSVGLFLHSALRHIEACDAVVSRPGALVEDVSLSGSVQTGRGKQAIKALRYHESNLSFFRAKDNRGRRHADRVQLKAAVFSGNMDCEPTLQTTA